MDVIFETSTGRYFSIEIGFFDTVLEIKEKVQKYQGYPVSIQKLVFNGQELVDNCNTEHYAILQNSCIYLIVTSTSSSGEGHSRLNILVNVPMSRQQLILEADTTETVSKFKDRIRIKQNIPTSRFVLFYRGLELQDQHTLAEYGIGNNSKVNLVMRPFPPALSSKKLILMVLPKAGMRKIPIEVTASDNVSELRKELQRLNGVVDFYRCPGGSFFLYRQRALEEEKSFLWHGMRDGDTVEIVDGCTLDWSLCM